jgi:type I restriction enzyme M protein
MTANTIHNDRQLCLKTDTILANPPFNISDWGSGRLSEDKRRQCGAPLSGNASRGRGKSARPASA